MALPGLGYTHVKDLEAGEFGSAVPFSWTASRASTKAKAKAKKK